MAAIYTFPTGVAPSAETVGPETHPTVLEGFVDYGAMVRTRGAVEISWPRVRAFRLRRHNLSKPGIRGDLATIVGDMCGAQAQILSAAGLALRARTRGLRPSDIHRALVEDRTLVAAWCMRGTRHFLPSEDFAIFSRGCHHIAGRWTSWFVRHRLPLEKIEQIVESMARAMDRPRTRAEVLALVTEDLGIRKRAKRMSRGWGNVAHTEGLELGNRVLSMLGMMGFACIRGIACCGHGDGKEMTFVRPDAWIPGWRDVPISVAERELVRRYLRGFGPATPEDFSIWAAFPLRGARAIWTEMAGELAEVSVDGWRAWVLRKDMPALRTARIDGPVVRLLPYFDSYLLGHRDKSHLIDAKHYRRVYRPAAWIAPAVLVDGRVAGTWNHEKGRGGIEVRIEAFGNVPRGVKEGIAAEAEDLGRFLEAPAHVTYG